MFSWLRRCALLCLVVVGVAVGAGPAAAVEMGPGTKNFTSPRGVPNYFSNEAEPFLGPGSPETGYARPYVRGGVSRHFIARRGRHYRGRTVIVRGRGPAPGRTVLARGRGPASGRAVLARGRGPAPHRLAAPDRRVASRAFARPVRRGDSVHPALRTVRGGLVGGGVHIVHAIHVVHTGHAVRAVPAVQHGPSHAASRPRAGPARRPG